jgi:beta-phosphoglucomutase-like phosphatase (HAD superfamily)
MGVRPEQCLVLEDAPSGVEAALAVGMAVAAAPNSAMSRSEYRNASQTLISLESFHPSIWALPPFPETVID